MNITHFIDDVGWKGGIETYVLNLIPRLDEKGINQSILYNSKEKDIGIGSHCTLYKKDKIKDIKSVLKREKTDVVHVHNIFDKSMMEEIKNEVNIVFTTHNYKLICPATNFYLKNTREICNISCSWKCFFTSAGYRCMPLRPPYIFRSYSFSKWALNNESYISHLVCPSKYAKKRHVEAGFEKSLMSVVPYFCSLCTVQEPEIPKENTITFMGRIRSYKGWEEFLKILSYLPKDVKGKMIGDFNNKKTKKVKGMANKLNVSERLTLRKWVDRSNIRDVFRETSVFVFPSIWPETLGIVGIEALSSGVPVVAFDVGGVEEWLINRKTGFFAEVKDCKTAADNVLNLIHDRSKMRSIGSNGIELVESKFSIERHINKIKSVYKKIT